MTVKGGDFSHYNSTIPDGLDFYILKCTEGDDYVDPTYAGRMDNLHAIKGAYHFFRMSADAGKQVQFFVDHAHIQPGDIVALDFENVNYDDWSHYAHSAVVNHATEVMNALIGAYPNNRVILYCNRSTYQSYVAGQIPTGDGLWIADPSQRPDYAPWLFWQYNSSTYDHDLSDAFVNVDALRTWAYHGHPDTSVAIPPPSPLEDDMVYLDAGVNMHDDVIVAGKTRLILGTGYGDHATIHNIDFWGSNDSGWNAVKVGVGGHVGEFTLNPDMPLYLPIPKGAIVASINWDSDHRIAAGAV